MRIKCNGCGKIVSTEIPDGTMIRAWIECPECIEKKYLLNEIDYIIKRIKKARAKLQKEVKTIKDKV